MPRLKALAAAALWAGLLAVPIRAAEAVRNPGTLIFSAAGEVTSLDPAYPYDGTSQGLIFNVYETLIAFERERNDRFTPLLAREVPDVRNGLVSKDGRTYRFPIRRGVRFHDGSLLTPEDVRYSLLRFMLQDRAGGPSALLLEPILGITSTRDGQGNIAVDFKEAERAVAVEGDEVVIRLKAPFAPFLSIMARWSYVMSRSWAAAQGDWDGSEETWKRFNNPDKESSPLFGRMNGTGAFKLERWDRALKKVYLARHEGYWRKPAALGRVIVQAVPEFATRKLLLEGGDSDIIELPRPFLSQVRGMKGVRVEDRLPRLMTDPAFFFTFQIQPSANPDIGSGVLDGDGIPPDFFQDRDVRLGFAYAFDYNAYIRDTFQGAATRAKGPIPPGLAGHAPGERFFTYDLKKAEAHLRKAHGGRVWERGFKFTLTYNTGGDIREYACRIMKKGIESLNPKFKVDLRGLEWSAYLDKAQKRMMPMFSRGWTADYPDPHNFAFPFYHSQGRYPSAQGYRNSELDKRVEAAARELDSAKRVRLYRELEELGFAEAPNVCTVHLLGVYGLRDWVKGFYDNAVFMGIYYYPLSK